MEPGPVLGSPPVVTTPRVTEAARRAQPGRKLQNPDQLQPGRRGRQDTAQGGGAWEGACRVTGKAGAPRPQQLPVRSIWRSIDLTGSVTERHGETETEVFHRLAHNLEARAGLGQSQEPGASSGSPTWTAGSQVYLLLLLVGTFSGRWIRSGTAGTPTGVTWDAWHHRPGRKPLHHKASDSEAWGREAASGLAPHADSLLLPAPPAPASASTSIQRVRETLALRYCQSPARPTPPPSLACGSRSTCHTTQGNHTAALLPAPRHHQAEPAAAPGPEAPGRPALACLCPHPGLTLRTAHPCHTQWTVTESGGWHSR